MRGHAGLVPFLFGIGGTDELPSSVLVALLGDLGLSASAARTLLSRMHARGDVATRRSGRRVDYRLAGATAMAFQRVLHADSPPPAWDGGFRGVLYTVPERKRWFRDALRRAAVQAGYGTLRPGLLISPYDRWDGIAATVEQRPPGALAYPVRLELGAADARAAAAEAWPLARLAEVYRDCTGRLEAALDRAHEQPPATGATLRAYTELVLHTYQAIVWDPGLPEALLPDRWPFPEVLRGLQAVDARFQPAIEEYVRTLRS